MSDWELGARDVPTSSGLTYYWRPSLFLHPLLCALSLSNLPFARATKGSAKARRVTLRRIESRTSVRILLIQQFSNCAIAGYEYRNK
jgi:hypothetical protein